MFGKKLLSVVGLLFLGSQIISVEAGCAPTLNEGECDPLGCGSGDDGLYFITDEYDQKSYTVEIKNDGTSCDKKEAEGVCGVSVDGEGHCNVNNNCLGEDNGKLFLNGSKIYKVTVNEETNKKITVSCGPETLSGNYCTTGSGSNIVSTIDGYCGVGGLNCAANGETYSCTDGVCDQDFNPRSCKRSTCGYNGTSFSGCNNGDYLIVDVGNGLVKDTKKTDGVLYHCTGSTTCDIVTDIKVGYYRNGGSINDFPYISCKKVGEPPSDSMQCAPIAVAPGACDSESIGKLVMGGNNKDVVNICLDVGISLLLEDDSLVDSEYFMEMEVTGTVFGGYAGESGEYAVVKVLAKGNEIHLVEEPNLAGHAPDMYKYSNIRNTIIEKDHNFDICQNPDQIVEFKLSKCKANPGDVAYYRKTREAKE